MDYTSEPPPEIIAGYRRIEPPFNEVFGLLLPMALTDGLQLNWQRQAFADDFARIKTVVPWIQYVAFCLSGKLVTEISSMACQSQLMDIRSGGPSSLVKRMGWEALFPPLTKAWDVLGRSAKEFLGRGFRGRGEVLAGVHDSNANYLRYLAGGQKKFTLLSTGTWIIGFDTEAKLESLIQEKDTVSNTDVFGNRVACCRFFGGREFEVLGEQSAKPRPWQRFNTPSIRILMPARVSPMAAGPRPTARKGFVIGDKPVSAEQRASLASLYCALMVSESLDALSSKLTSSWMDPFQGTWLFWRCWLSCGQGKRFWRLISGMGQRRVRPAWL